MRMRFSGGATRERIFHFLIGMENGGPSHNKPMCFHFPSSTPFSFLSPFSPPSLPPSNSIDYGDVVSLNFSLCHVKECDIDSLPLPLPLYSALLKNKNTKTKNHTEGKKKKSQIKQVIINVTQRDTNFYLLL